jgi:hypothetical protein
VAEAVYRKIHTPAPARRSLQPIPFSGAETGANPT